MTDVYLNAELAVDVLGQVLGGIDGAVLAACAAEAEHQAGEAALNVTAHVGIGQTVNGVEEG